MEPSNLFKKFIAKYLESQQALDFRRHGSSVEDIGGSFTASLYRGDIIEVIGYADRTNKIKIKKLLFPDDYT